MKQKLILVVALLAMSFGFAQNNAPRTIDIVIVGTDLSFNDITKSTTDETTYAANEMTFKFKNGKIQFYERSLKIAEPFSWTDFVEPVGEDLSTPASTKAYLKEILNFKLAGGGEGSVGPAGPEGPQGETGPAGPEGPQGAQGIQGIQGPVGADGPAGADGADGADGVANEAEPFDFNNQSTAYTFISTDANNSVIVNAQNDVTIPSGVFDEGQAIRIKYNFSASGDINVIAGAGVTIRNGTTTLSSFGSGVTVARISNATTPEIWEIIDSWGTTSTVAAFDPSGLSQTLGGEYDLRDSSTITSDANGVSQVNDLSGLDRHLTQSVIARMVNEGVEDGYNGLRFIKANLEHLSTTTPFLWDSGESTIFMIAKLPNQSDSRPISEGGASSSIIYGPFSQPGGADNADMRLFIRDDSNVTVVDAAIANGALDNTLKLYTIIDTGSAFIYRINGVETHNITYDRTGHNLTLNNLTLGALLRGAAVSSGTEGWMGYVRLYEGALNGTELTDSEADLMGKFGL